MMKLSKKGCKLLIATAVGGILTVIVMWVLIGVTFNWFTAASAEISSEVLYDIQGLLSEIETSII